MDLEAEYNNRARVPEHPEIIARWVEDSRRYREGGHCELALSYGDTERSVVDLFHPATGAEEAPLAVFIHGGYWQAMDGQTFSCMARGLNEHGITVAVPTYDLCPNVTIAQIVEQVRACLAWLWQRTGRSITALGHSAGGHLTAAMVATDWPRYDRSLPPDLCVRGYAISGVFDLEPLIPTSLNTALRLDEHSARDQSPRHWAVHKAAHLTAAVGGNESSEFLRQSKDMSAAWRAAGVDTAYRELDGEDHFTVIDGLTDPESAMVRELVSMVHMDAPKGP